MKADKPATLGDFIVREMRAAEEAKQRRDADRKRRLNEKFHAIARRLSRD